MLKLYTNPPAIGPTIIDSDMSEESTPIDSPCSILGVLAMV